MRDGSGNQFQERDPPPVYEHLGGHLCPDENHCTATNDAEAEVYDQNGGDANDDGLFPETLFIELRLFLIHPPSKAQEPIPDRCPSLNELGLF